MAKKANGKWAATTEGAPQLQKELARLSGLAKGMGVKLAAGYGAPHALVVHERTDMPHPNGGQAKYLEQPLRLLSPQLGKLIAGRVRGGKSPEKAFRDAAELLHQGSAPLVPVDTGELVNSWFVRVEKA